MRCGGRLRWVAAGLLVLLAVGPHLRGIEAPFNFDDRNSIPNNESLRTLWPPSVALTPPPQSTLASRPLVSYSFAINYALHGLDVRGYHIGNLLFHAGCSLLLWGLLRRSLARVSPPLSQPAIAEPLAFTAALLWAMHPLHTETVTYIVQRTELMASLFILLGLYSLTRGGDAVRDGHQAWTWWGLALAACYLGVASKEIAFALPLLMLLQDRALIAGTFATALRQRWGLYLAAAGSWGLLAWLMLWSPRDASVGYHHGVSAWSYLLTQSEVICWYLRLSLWPDALRIHYDWPMVRHWWQAAGEGPIVLAMLGGAFYTLWRRPALAVPAWGFFLVLAPTSSVVPIITEVAAERRMYLPLAGLMVLAVLGLWGLGWWLSVKRPRLGPKLRWAAVAGTLGIAVAAGVRSYLRNAEYDTNPRIWSAVLRYDPDDEKALNNLGRHLLNQNRPRQALPHLIRSHLVVMRLKTALNLAEAWDQTGHPEHAERTLRLARLAWPHERLPLQHYARFLTRQGRDAEAEPRWRTVIERWPQELEAYHQLGQMLARQGRTDQARAIFHAALAVDPDDAIALNNLGVVAEQANRLQRAAELFRQAAEADPSYALAHENLGHCFRRLGRPREALAAYEQALTQYEQPTRALKRTVADLKARLKPTPP